MKESLKFLPLFCISLAVEAIGIPLSYLTVGENFSFLDVIYEYYLLN